MINETVFATAWSLICERFNRDASNALSEQYYNLISERMDTASFRQAASRVIAENEFFPRPADFWEAVQLPPEADALDQWELCLRIMEGDSVLDRMNPCGQRVVALLGGPNKLRNTQLDSVPFVRKDFLAYYRDVNDGVARGHLLPGAEVTPESRRIVDDLMRNARMIAPPKRTTA